MGQIYSKVNELVNGEDRSGLQESKGMLHDIISDDSDLNIGNIDDSDLLNCTPKTPPNIINLKCDPRSPNFNRTPIKIPLSNND